MLQEGQQAPDFTMKLSGGGVINLGELRGKKVVLYFYPKDDTPGCTTEACGFRNFIGDFDAAGAEIIGVSRDSVASHDKFKAKHELSFALASDEDGAVTGAYGTWIEKNMYGKTYMGVERATFLIDEKGVIQMIWRKIKVPGHVEAVLESVRSA